MKYHEFNYKEHKSQYKSLFLFFTIGAKFIFVAKSRGVYKGVTEGTHTPWVFEKIYTVKHLQLTF